MDKSALGIFDGEAAQKGYALNKMCHTFNDADSRAAFLADEEGYCARFGLNEEQRAAVKSRDRAALVAAGGNLYFLQKFLRIFDAVPERRNAPEGGVKA